jgi:quercetin dioxygenase-like cupin family protein
MSVPASSARITPAVLALAAVHATAQLSDRSAATGHDTTRETLAPLFQGPLPNVEGRTFTSAIVRIPPGARAVPHRDGQAFVYAYVLEGTLRSQLDDGPARIYRTGDSWIEPPNAHHVLTENASTVASARLLVIFISHTGESLKTEDRQ